MSRQELNLVCEFTNLCELTFGGLQPFGKRNTFSNYGEVPFGQGVTLGSDLFQLGFLQVELELGS